jgi:hypothetical protein
MLALRGSVYSFFSFSAMNFLVNECRPEAPWMSFVELEVKEEADVEKVTQGQLRMRPARGLERERGGMEGWG